MIRQAHHDVLIMTDEQKETIKKLAGIVQAELANAEGGHDWWHILRVWRTAQNIASHEKCNKFVVELGALLHDIADAKFNDSDEQVGPTRAREILTGLRVEEQVIEHVVKIVENISFKGGKHEQVFKSIELDITQDADRLDAMGAIGIARTFNYGGHKGREIYNPNFPPNLEMTKEQYMNSTAPSLNHFYEKLLLLKDRMNTKTGKDLAQKRHDFMAEYLEQFYREWDGEG